MPDLSAQEALILYKDLLCDEAAFVMPYKHTQIYTR